MIRRYTRLVRAYAHRFFLLGGDYEDLVQEGMIGLLNAIRQYHSDSVGSFSSFAAICINSRLISAVRAAAAKKHAPLNESVSFFNESAAFTLSDISFSGPEELLIHKEQYTSYMIDLIQILSPFERQVLKAYLNGLSCSEIADNIHKPLRSVGNALQRIKTKAATVLSKR